MRVGISILFFLGCWAGLAAQSVRLSGRLSHSEVSLQQVFRVTYTLEGAYVDDFTLPEFTGLVLEEGPHRSARATIKNGKSVPSESWTISLRAQREGILEIPPALAKAGTNTYKSNPLSVRVAAAPDLRIETILSEQTVYVGQQFTVDYQLVTSGDYGRPNIIDVPAYQGFHWEKGRMYNSILQSGSTTEERRIRLPYFRSLYPLRSGTLTLEPLQVSIIKKQSAEELTTEDPNFYVSSAAVPIKVMPLPPGAPISFSGAVGVFSANSQLDTSRLAAYESLRLRLRIEGTGDVERVLPPVFSVPDHFEAYQTQTKEHPLRDSIDLLWGSRTFDYIYVPTEAGTFTIQPAFSYFDPSTGRYETIQLAGHTVEVLPGQRPTDAITDLTLIDTLALLPVVETPAPRKKRIWFRTAGYWWLLSIPAWLALGALAWWAYWQLQDPKDLRRRRAAQGARRALRKGEQAAKQGKYDEALQAVESAFFGYGENVWGWARSRRSKSFLQESLTGLGFSNTDELLAVISAGEQARYQPGSANIPIDWPTLRTWLEDLDRLKATDGIAD